MWVVDGRPFSNSFIIVKSSWIGDMVVKMEKVKMKEEQIGIKTKTTKSRHFLTVTTLIM